MYRVVNPTMAPVWGSRTTESKGTMCGWSRGSRLQLLSSNQVRNMPLCMYQYLKAAFVVAVCCAALDTRRPLVGHKVDVGPRRSSSVRLVK